MCDTIPDYEFLCWQLLVQMVQMVISCCRRNGWTNEDIELFENVAWRHNILSEETFGLSACVITEHNLIHVSEDIYRFSSPDNYWVFDLERAVKRYVNQSTNHKNIEKTYSSNKVRREVLQILNITSRTKKNPVLSQDERDTLIKCKQVSSLKQGISLVSQGSPSALKSGIAVGACGKKAGFHNITLLQQREVWEEVISDDRFQFEFSIMQEYS